MYYVELMLTIRDGFEDEQSLLLKEEKIMLQKLKVTSYAFIYFVLFGFSFISLQVTTEEVEAAGVCEPVERIRNMKDTARHSDYTLWVDRCQVSGSNGQCGDTTEWPAGDGGRCEMTTADSHDMARGLSSK